MSWAIIPENDLKEHDEFSTTCECEPKIEFVNGEMLIIHNAFDQREIIEQLEFIDKQQDLDPEFNNIVNENFWDLLDSKQ